MIARGHTVPRLIDSSVNFARLALPAVKALVRASGLNERGSPGKRRRKDASDGRASDVGNDVRPGGRTTPEGGARVHCPALRTPGMIHSRTLGRMMNRDRREEETDAPEDREADCAEESASGGNGRAVM